MIIYANFNAQLEDHLNVLDIQIRSVLTERSESRALPDRTEPRPTFDVPLCLLLGHLLCIFLLHPRYRLNDNLPTLIRRFQPSLDTPIPKKTIIPSPKHQCQLGISRKLLLNLLHYCLLMHALSTIISHYGRKEQRKRRAESPSPHTRSPSSCIFRKCKLRGRYDFGSESCPLIGSEPNVVQPLLIWESRGQAVVVRRDRKASPGCRREVCALAVM